MANKISIDLELEGKDALTAVKSLEKAFDKLGNEATKDVKKIDGALGSFAGNLGAIAATRAFDFVKDQIAGAAQAFIDFEAGLIGVAKTTNFSKEDVAQFTDNIEKLTKEIPAGTDELLGIAEAAGQLGVSGVKNVTLFTETIAKLGRVSNLQGDEAATVLTRILNVAGENIDQIGVLANVIVDLGNNFAASEAEIARVANEVTRATQNYGVASVEAAALSAALRSLGIRAEEAGGVINRSFQAIDLAIRDGGKSAQRLSEVTGIAVEDLKEQFGKDAIGVFRNFVAGLGKVSAAGGSVAAALEEFGLKGVRVTSVIPALANNVKLLDDALSRANIQVKESNALNGEYEKILDATGTKVQLFQNAVDELARNLAGELAPTLNNVLDVTTAFLEKLAADTPLEEAQANAKGLAATIKDVGDTTKTVNSFLPDFLANINQSFADDRVKRLNAELEITKGQIEDLTAGAGEDGQVKKLTEDLVKAEEVLKKLEADFKGESEGGLVEYFFGKGDGKSLEKELEDLRNARFEVAKLKTARERLIETRKAQAEFEEQQRQKNVEGAKAETSAIVAAEVERKTLLDEIRLAAKQQKDLESEEEKLAKQLEADENFQFLSENLGREQAARELFRIKQIEDEKKRVQELKKLRTKAQAEEEKRQKLAAQQQLQLEQKTAQAKVDILKSAANLATVIGKEGSKEVFLIQKAAALAQAIVATNTAVAQALAVPPAPNLPLAKLAKVSGATNIAAITAATIKGFQSGGIAPEPVSGVVESPSQTGDQTLIGVNGGEVIFNKRQQQNLFDLVNRGGGGAGGGTNITINNPVLLDEGSVDTLIDQINDRVEFANRELKSTELLDEAS